MTFPKILLIAGTLTVAATVAQAQTSAPANRKAGGKSPEQPFTITIEMPQSIVKVGSKIPVKVVSSLASASVFDKPIPSISRGMGLSQLAQLDQ